jgi:hypothetical protein
MIVDLARLKSKLGIAADDNSHDTDLTDTITEQTEWVERETHRRFDAPVERTETMQGPGRVVLWLSGHIEMGNADHPEWAVVTVTERVAWTQVLTLDVDTYDVRGGDSLASLVRTDGYVWSIGAEYDVTYFDGYAVAPADIQSLVLALSVAAYRLDQATADGSAGITSETLVGVYSYTIDRRRASLEADGTLSEQSLRTLNRWKRMLA